MIIPIGKKLLKPDYKNHKVAYTVVMERAKRIIMKIMKNQLSWIIGDNIKKAIKDIDSFLESRSGRLVVMTDTEEKSHWTVLSLATWQRYEFRQSCC